MSTSKPVTYSSYLQLDALLQLQQPLSEGPEHDETLFIVIHQVYELWFKQLLHELDALERGFAAVDTARALAALKRMLTILKTLVQQVDVLETMTPLSFNAFRTRLEASSGFQSAQFRTLEFRLGHKRAALAALRRGQCRSRSPRRCTRSTHRLGWLFALPGRTRLRAAGCCTHA